MNKKNIKQKISKINTINLILSLWKIFEKKRKIQFSLLILLMFLSGIFESITIKLVIPLLSNLINPEKVNSNFFNEIIFFCLLSFRNKGIK